MCIGHFKSVQGAHKVWFQPVKTQTWHDESVTASVFAQFSTYFIGAVKKGQVWPDKLTGHENRKLWVWTRQLKERLVHCRDYREAGGKKAQDHLYRPLLDVFLTSTRSFKSRALILTQTISRVSVGPLTLFTCLHLLNSHLFLNPGYKGGNDPFYKKQLLGKISHDTKPLITQRRYRISQCSTRTLEGWQC